MSKKIIISKPAALSDISNAKKKAAVQDFTGPAIIQAAALLAAWTDGWPQQSAEGSVRAGYLRIFPSGNWMIRPIRRLVTTSARLILGEQKPELNPVQDSVGLAVQSAALFFGQDESQHKEKVWRPKTTDVAAATKPFSLLRSTLRQNHK